MKPKSYNPIKLKNEHKISPVDTTVMDYVSNIEIMIERSQSPKTFFQKILYNNSVKVLNREISGIKAEIKKENVKDQIKHKSRIITKLCNIIAVKNMFDTKGWSNAWTLTFNPNTTMMVFMELRSGKFIHFIVALKHPYFDYEDGRYIVDDEMKYYVASSNMWCCDYHQDCCLPLKRKIDVNKINETVTEQGIDTETSINPVSFKVFMESDIIQKVIKGAEMDQWLGFVKAMLIALVCMIMVTIVIGIYIITKVQKI